MADAATKYPRLVIEYCTQCHWMLRAAWFAQELLSTFSNSIGEVALQPATGGTFTVHLFHAVTSSEDGVVTVQKHLLWDRKAEGGFPEAKELKRRVRDIIDPARNLGHVDRGKDKSTSPSIPIDPTTTTTDFNSSTTDTNNHAPHQPPSPSTPLPLTFSHLQLSAKERKFTPMDVDLPTPAAERAEPAAEDIQGKGPFCPPGEECDYNESDDR